MWILLDSKESKKNCCVKKYRMYQSTVFIALQLHYLNLSDENRFTIHVKQHILKQKHQYPGTQLKH